jgi:hypothetical protein
MEREDIRQTLRRDLEAATGKLASILEELDTIVRELPRALPHPDGAQRFHSAAETLSVARKALETFARLNAFVPQGMVPDDLKKRCGCEER